MTALAPSPILSEAGHPPPSRWRWRAADTLALRIWAILQAVGHPLALPTQTFQLPRPCAHWILVILPVPSAADVGHVPRSLL
ncbi:uncharacterized protein BDR25DRAFT_299562 [Lindgomyces ingoldianus]|uniref:Uncharacterized protein n=1 Tax=Lindgomyces ingoldianus TaxID=673940 RepID=A0ACB6REQ1_9PLEO|nr:uncharacterized protein BDR25DRAFT_299562 [Lindgomyces ingoldianus]KAF2477763.1 hypothetical protein BDR25DRAFT_299562 [Lindgomyces ingoldianus]